MNRNIGIFLGATLLIAVSGGPVLAQNVFMPANTEPPAATATPSGDKIDHTVSAKVALKRAKAAGKNKKFDDEGKWYGVAAEKGNAEGQYRYGLYLYDTAMGEVAWEWAAKDKDKWDAQIASDKQEGQDWLQKAAAQGNKKAVEALEEIKSGTTPYPPGSSATPSNEAPTKSASTILQAASGSTPVANDAAQPQKGTEAAAPLGETLSGQASNAADTSSSSTVETAIQNGDYYSDPQKGNDDKKAVEFYTQAANLGSVQAMVKLGDLYNTESAAMAVALYSDEDVNNTTRQALYWYGQAANQGNDYAAGKQKELQEELQKNGN